MASHRDFYGLTLVGVFVHEAQLVPVEQVVVAGNLLLLGPGDKSFEERGFRTI
jgi:hypothetical protein